MGGSRIGPKSQQEIEKEAKLPNPEEKSLDDTASAPSSAEEMGAETTTSTASVSEDEATPLITPTTVRIDVQAVLEGNATPLEEKILTELLKEQERKNKAQPEKELPFLAAFRDTYLLNEFPAEPLEEKYKNAYLFIAKEPQPTPGEEPTEKKGLEINICYVNAQGEQTNISPDQNTAEALKKFLARRDDTRQTFIDMAAKNGPLKNLDRDTKLTFESLLPKNPAGHYAALEMSNTHAVNYADQLYNVQLTSGIVMLAEQSPPQFQIFNPVSLSYVQGIATIYNSPGLLALTNDELTPTPEDKIIKFETILLKSDLTQKIKDYTKTSLGTQDTDFRIEAPIIAMTNQSGGEATIITVMTMAKGNSIENQIREEEGRAWLKQNAFAACNAILTAYENQIGRKNWLHGDIKTGNIILDSSIDVDGNTIISAKLIDFDDINHNPDKPKVFSGTPTYIAPEQRAAGEKREDPMGTREAENYQLGLVLLNTVLARNVISDNTLDDNHFNPDLLKKDLARALAEVRQLGNPKLSFVIEGLLDPNPNNRLTHEEAMVIMQGITLDDHLKNGASDWLEKNGVPACYAVIAAYESQHAKENWPHFNLKPSSIMLSDIPHNPGKLATFATFFDERNIELATQEAKMGAVAKPKELERESFNKLLVNILLDQEINIDLKNPQEVSEVLIEIGKRHGNETAQIMEGLLSNDPQRQLNNRAALDKFDKILILRLEQPPVLRIPERPSVAAATATVSHEEPKKTKSLVRSTSGKIRSTSGKITQTLFSASKIEKEAAQQQREALKQTAPEEKGGKLKVATSLKITNRATEKRSRSFLGFGKKREEKTQMENIASRHNNPQGSSTRSKDKRENPAEKIKPPTVKPT